MWVTESGELGLEKTTWVEVKIEPEVKAQVERKYILLCLTKQSQFSSVFLVLLLAVAPFYSPTCLSLNIKVHGQPMHKLNCE